MECLSDDLLLDTYYKAIELNLNPDFLFLIKREIDIRGLAHEMKYI